MNSHERRIEALERVADEQRVDHAGSRDVLLAKLDAMSPRMACESDGGAAWRTYLGALSSRLAEG